MRNMREYYLENFPTDEMGIEINENATFEGLFRVLDNYEDVYEYIGVGDSVIRERVFSRLSEYDKDKSFLRILFFPHPEGEKII
jgi:hypothetical protein